MTKKKTDIEACVILRQAGMLQLADEAYKMTPTFDKFLTDHLRLWKDEGIDAPVNELRSIHVWMRHLKANGAEATLATMAARLVLLTHAANDLNALGSSAEDEAGIYDNRPDMKPIS